MKINKALASNDLEKVAGGFNSSLVDVLICNCGAYTTFSSFLDGRQAGLEVDHFVRNHVSKCTKCESRGYRTLRDQNPSDYPNPIH